MSDGARGRLIRWVLWFAMLNVALMAIVGLRYLWHYSPPDPWIAWVYAILAFAGHLTALACVPALLLLALGVLFPRPRLILPVGVVLGSVLLSFLVLDSLLFAENRYHLTLLTFSLLEPRTWAFLTVYLLASLALEGMLALSLWTRTERPPTTRFGRYLAAGLVGCLVASHLVYAWAFATDYVPVTSFTRVLPLYFPLTDTRTLVRVGLLDRYQARQRSLVAALGRPLDGALNYPAAPLRCSPPSPMPSVLLVVIDAMRADALRPDAAPRLTAFAQHAIQFDAHYSGGNTSRPGMFSLFYGLPATYWSTFAGRAWPPVLMDRFRQYHYQLGLFASAPLYRAVELDRTALARIPHLRKETSTTSPGSSGRDAALTDEWLHWIDRRDPSLPFFGFLYYDTVVANEPPENYPLPVPPPPGASAQQRLHARYLAAVHYVDALVGRVLDDLERRRLLDQTVVIITSDHGMEFDENGLGFTGHGTSYSDYQLHAPLLVRWPGRPAPERVSRRTSHYDVVPTLLVHLFGCTNPPADYASGHDLFSDAQWDWLIAASYHDFALIEPERVTIVLPTGYEIRDGAYRLVRHPTLPRDSLRAALSEMSRFYR